MLNSQPLVSTSWLTENINNPNIRIFDSSWHMPNAGRNAKAEYDNAHVAGALFFDVDEIADTENSLPHMMPSEEKMAVRLRSFGISNSDHIIMYDNSVDLSATRGWYRFRKDNLSLMILPFLPKAIILLPKMKMPPGLLNN